MNPARNCVNLKKTILLSKAFSGNLKNRTFFFLQGKKKSEFNPAGLVIRALPSQLKSHPCKSENGNCFLLGSAETLPRGEESQLHLSRMPSGRGMYKGLLRLLQETVWSCSSVLHPTGSLTLGTLRQDAAHER